MIESVELAGATHQTAALDFAINPDNYSGIELQSQVIVAQ